MALNQFMQEKGVYLERKIKSAIRKENPGVQYIFNLSNIVLNGLKIGCHGHITNPENQSTVYITTEYCPYGHFMYKYKDNPLEQKGYRNHWDGKDSFPRFIEFVVKALEHTPQEIGDSRI